MVRFDAPINVKITIRIHWNDSLQAAGSFEDNLPMRQIHRCVVQVQPHGLRPKHNAHLPQTLHNQRPGLARHPGRQFLSPKIRYIEVSIFIQRYLNVLFSNPGHYDLPRFDSGAAQINAVARVRFYLPERAMPISKILKRPHPAQDTVNIRRGGDDR